tara:strand:- start:134 stop:460 length:327 start_codon:yes stop_codon:yes gene_type:complete
MGLVLIECATNKYPYSGINSMIEMAQTVTEAAPPTLPPSSGFSSEFHNFVDLCLRKDPKERPEAKTLLGHAWLKEIGCNTMKSATKQCKDWVDILLGVDGSSDPSRKK